MYSFFLLTSHQKYFKEQTATQQKPRSLSTLNVLLRTSGQTSSINATGGLKHKHTHQLHRHLLSNRKAHMLIMCL